MKISRPTNVTITSMMAVSGSSTQPSCNHWPPNWNQLKLNHFAEHAVRRGGCSVAQTRRAKAGNQAIEPMASVAASLRCRCLFTAIMPAATSGSTGISQRFCDNPGHPFKSLISSRLTVR
jgi:hypothetical protein